MVAVTRRLILGTLLVVTVAGGAWALRGPEKTPLTQTVRSLKTEGRFTRLDVVVEFPFGRSEPVVTMGGCLDNALDARDARRRLYAAGAVAVFDATQRTPMPLAPGYILTPGYIDSVCNPKWMHDGRSMFRFMTMPARPLRDATVEPQVRRALETDENLQSLGVSRLATVLQELHRDLTLWRRGVYDPGTLIRHLQMKLEILARMPPQEVKGSARPVRFQAGSPGRE